MSNTSRAFSGSTLVVVFGFVNWLRFKISVKVFPTFLATIIVCKTLPCIKFILYSKTSWPSDGGAGVTWSVNSPSKLLIALSITS